MCLTAYNVQVPFIGMNEAKKNYFTQDLRDWCQYAGIKLNFPRAFPLRTVLPLRATLASNCDPVIIKMLCMYYMSRVVLSLYCCFYLYIDKAAWQDDLNIGENDVR